MRSYAKGARYKRQKRKKIRRQRLLQSCFKSIQGDKIRTRREKRIRKRGKRTCRRDRNELVVHLFIPGADALTGCRLICVWCCMLFLFYCSSYLAPLFLSFAALIRQPKAPSHAHPSSYSRALLFEAVTHTPSSARSARTFTERETRAVEHVLASISVVGGLRAYYLRQDGNRHSRHRPRRKPFPIRKWGKNRRTKRKN